MSDAPGRKRCPNCAWALGLAEVLQLPQEESWILTIIAENIGPDLRLHATLAELARLTRMKPATLSKHIRRLAAHTQENGDPACIEMIRSRDGYHYRLMRPPEAHDKPIQPRRRRSIIDDQEQQILPLSTPPEVAEVQNLPVKQPLRVAKFDDLERQNLTIPILDSLKSPLGKEERALLRNDASASPRVVGVLDQPDIRRQMWSEGRAILRRLTGQLNGQAGKQIGAFLKASNGDCTIVLDAMRAADREGPYEPVPWIFAGIKARLAPAEPTYRNPANQIAAKLGLFDREFHDSFWSKLTDDTSAFQKEAAGGSP